MWLCIIMLGVLAVGVRIISLIGMYILSNPRNQKLDAPGSIGKKKKNQKKLAPIG
jgi:hypothetical protein